jgi:hypothetical protein
MQLFLWFMDERMKLLIIFKLFMNEIQTFFFFEFLRRSWNNVKILGTKKKV